MSCIRNRNTHIWYSSPCTGGCPFNLGINWAIGDDTRNKILAHWKVHDLVWTGFKRVAAHAHHHGCTISIEWAHRCAYHRLKSTRQLVSKYGLEYRMVSGCSVRLMSENPKTKGQLLCKAWGIWSNNPEILQRLIHLRCNSLHTRVACEGRDTEHSGNYTDPLAKIIHLAFRAHWDSTPQK